MSYDTIDSVAHRIRAGGVLAIIRGQYQAGQILSIANILANAGLTAMEVTLNSPQATDHIKLLRGEIGHRLLIGAGTVRTAADVDRAIGAGAQFLISPGFNAESVAQSQAANVLHLPGVFTPTEAQTAVNAGCSILKLFPCDVVGPAYLKAIRAPLNDVEFVPTGGVSIDNIGLWRRAGAFAVAAGSALVSGPDQSPADLTMRATSMRRIWEAAAND